MMGFISLFLFSTSVSLQDLEGCLELQPNWLGSCQHAYYLTFPAIWHLGVVSLGSNHWQRSCFKLNGPPKTLRQPSIWLCIAFVCILLVASRWIFITSGMPGTNTIPLSLIEIVTYSWKEDSSKFSQWSLLPLIHLYLPPPSSYTYWDIRHPSIHNMKLIYYTPGLLKLPLLTTNLTSAWFNISSGLHSTKPINLLNKYLWVYGSM